MFSFKSIVVFAALLTSTLSVAAPATSLALSKRESFDTETTTFPISARDDSLKSLPKIVTDLTADLSPLSNQLLVLPKNDLTVASIEPITVEMNSLIVAATADVKKLVGQPLGIVMAIPNGVLTFVQATGLIANLLQIVFVALVFVLRTVSILQAGVVAPLIVGVGATVGDLVNNIIISVSDIKGTLIPVLLNLVSYIRQLNINVLLKLLGLNV